MPDHITFQPKWQIALGQIQAVQAEGVPRAPVLADAGYGDTTALRDALTTAGLTYVVGVKKETTAWPPGDAPRPPKRWKGRGRPPTRVRRTATHTPRSVKQLAGALPASTSLAMSEVGASGPHPSSTRAKRGSAARHSASGSPSSRRTILAPRTIETIL